METPDATEFSLVVEEIDDICKLMQQISDSAGFMCTELWFGTKQLHLTTTRSIKACGIGEGDHLRIARSSFLCTWFNEGRQLEDERRSPVCVCSQHPTSESAANTVPQTDPGSQVQGGQVFAQVLCTCGARYLGWISRLTNEMCGGHGLVVALCL